MLRTFAAALFTGLLALPPALRAEDPVPKKEPLDVDLVLCLDVSGSMNGLLESAKVKLWTVVNDLAKLKPVPNLRVALYTYGGEGAGYDPKAGWVKQEIELTSDLDEVYKRLTPLHTSGHVEYVARVTKTALTDQKWSKAKNSLRMLFVCGNEAATQDRENPLATVASLAKEMGVYVNTIYCGSPTDGVAAGYADFAKMAGGRYATINQNKVNDVAIASPFDKEILELNTKLNTTYVAYGAKGAEAAANQSVQDKNAENASKQVAAGGQVVNQAAISRAESKAGALYRNSHWDLVDRMKTDKEFDVKKLKEEELCEEMKKLKPEEREPYLQKKLAEREAIQKSIQELSVKRATFVSEERKKLPQSDADAALDNALLAILRDQAASKGYSK